MSTRKPRIGRPPKAPEDVKSHTIQFRVTASEYNTLSGGAEADDMTLSGWLLWLGIRRSKAVR